jgi:hypothetical protein
VLQSILVPNQIYDYYENTITIARNKDSKTLGLFQDAHNEKTYFLTLLFINLEMCKKNFKLSYCPMGVLSLQHAENFLDINFKHMIARETLATGLRLKRHKHAVLMLLQPITFL